MINKCYTEAKKVNTNIYDIITKVNKTGISAELKEEIIYNLERQSNEIKSLCHEIDKLKNEQIKISHLEINDGKINKITLVGDNLVRYN